jgi:hypothetical protein
MAALAATSPADDVAPPRDLASPHYMLSSPYASGEPVKIDLSRLNNFQEKDAKEKDAKSHAEVLLAPAKIAIRPQAGDQPHGLDSRANKSKGSCDIVSQCRAGKRSAGKSLGYDPNVLAAGHFGQYDESAAFGGMWMPACGWWPVQADVCPMEYWAAAAAWANGNYYPMPAPDMLMASTFEGQEENQEQDGNSKLHETQSDDMESSSTVAGSPLSEESLPSEGPYSSASSDDEMSAPPGLQLPAQHSTIKYESKSMPPPLPPPGLEAPPGLEGTPLANTRPPTLSDIEPPPGLQQCDEDCWSTFMIDASQPGQTEVAVAFGLTPTSAAKGDAPCKMHVQSEEEANVQTEVDTTVGEASESAATQVEKRVFLQHREFVLQQLLAMPAEADAVQELTVQVATEEVHESSLATAVDVNQEEPEEKVEPEAEPQRVVEVEAKSSLSEASLCQLSPMPADADAEEHVEETQSEKAPQAVSPASSITVSLPTPKSTLKSTSTRKARREAGRTRAGNQNQKVLVPAVPVDAPVERMPAAPQRALASPKVQSVRKALSDDTAKGADAAEQAKRWSVITTTLFAFCILPMLAVIDVVLPRAFTKEADVVFAESRVVIAESGPSYAWATSEASAPHARDQRVSAVMQGLDVEVARAKAVSSEIMKKVAKAQSAKVQQNKNKFWIQEQEKQGQATCSGGGGGGASIPGFQQHPSQAEFQAWAQQQQAWAQQHGWSQQQPPHGWMHQQQQFVPLTPEQAWVLQQQARAR